MNKAHINPSMIILAREARGFSQAELADRINLSPANLSKIERNEIGISETTLSTISEITFLPTHFFYQKGDILPVNLSYRMRQQVAQKLITPIEAKINIIRKHIQFLNRSLGQSQPAIPSCKVDEKNTPFKIASFVRKQWKITDPVIKDLAAVIEANGIALHQFDFGTERVDSRSILTDDRYPIIFINKKLSGDRQRFSLAYELGHIIMHTYNILSAGADISHEANQFAAAFLMPAKEIKKDFEQGINLAVLANLKRKWKVSMIALLYRADDLGLLTPNQKRYLLQQFNQMKIRRREPPELDIAPVTFKLIRQWIATYRQKTKVGVADMAALLCLYVDEYLEWYS